jgi:hypothetical protein
MAESPGTVEQLALVLGRMLQPLATRLESGDVLGLLTELGLALPPQLLADQGFLAGIQTGAASAGTLPDIVANLVAAIEADDGAAAVTAAGQLIHAGTGVVSSFTTIADALQAAAGGLPGVDQAVVTAFAAELPGKLLSYLVVTFLESAHPVVASTAVLAGIIERTPMPGVSGDPTQPAYTSRGLDLSRIGDFLHSPGDVLHSVYGWGDPGFGGADLLLRLWDLLAAAGISAGFDPPTATTPAALHFLLLKITPDASLSPPGLRAALSVPVQDGLSLTVPLFKPGWSAVIQAQGTLDAGVSATITPPAALALQPVSGSISGSLSVGFQGQPAPPATSLVLVGQAGGSRAQATEIEVSFGVTFSWDSGSGTAKGGLTASARISGGSLLIDLSSGDGFLQSITGGAQLTSNFGLGVTWSDTGLHIDGSGALEIAIPTHISIGPIDIEQLVLSAGPAPDGSLPTEISATFSGNLGPLQASVERAGLLVTVSFPAGGGNLGPVDLGFAFKPPNGVGISIDAGMVSGGGFLYVDTARGEYAGAIQLEFADFLSLSAIGLIDTRLPDGSPGFSLLIIITADFGAGLQLGFGFTLNAVGGLLGVNRTVLMQPLMDGVRSGAINSLMFPQDIVANAPKIISDLRSVFPPQQGTFLIGPMARLGWGEPTLVSLSLGVIAEIPPGDVAIVGVLELALPAEDLAILVLQVNFAGVLEFSKQRMYFFASLYDSHILFIPIEGEMGLLFAWGDNANFVLTVGGFHPQYNPPPLPFPAPKRISVDIINESYARIHADGYFAVTTNTVQFGTHSEYFFGFSALSMTGNSSFDALIEFSPFHFSVSIATSFSVQVFGLGVFGVDLSLTLDGPEPWHAHGTASLSFLFFSIGIGIDFTWGDSGNTTLPPVAVMPILAAEFGKQSNWRTMLPPGSKLLVSLRALSPSESQFVLHPFGTLQVSQRAIPLDLTLDTVGSQKPDDANRFAVSVSSPDLVQTATLQEPFAPAQFTALDDAAKLSQPAYVPQDSGIEVSAAGNQDASGTAIVRIVRYDVTIIDTKLRRSSSGFNHYPGTMFQHGLRGNAAARSTLSAAREQQTHPYTGSVQVSAETFAVARQSDNTVYHPQAAAFTSQASARDYIDRAVAADPTLAGALHVLPQFEVAS